MTITLTGPDQLRAELAGAPQYRAATLDVLNGDERVIELRAVPYDVETRLGAHVVESFAPGAFARAAKDPGRCKLYHGHGTPELGNATEIRDQADGVFCRLYVSKTQRGDDLLTLAHDKVLDEASIEFNPLRDGMVITQRGDDTVVRHKRAHLCGVALVGHGAYGRDALVMSVRDAAADKARDEWLARLRSRTA